MGLWTLLTGTQTTTPAATGRTPRERARRTREIRKIDASTTTWLQNGGLTRKRDSR
ncbi:hypothetical protein [Kitasatospora cineracea]|uniref:hypothetical protein n=1 Tax=Kitasatospora cineracea TaxID=88074 RepID=UPI0036AF4BAA